MPPALAALALYLVYVFACFVVASALKHRS
jgi:hypothetical protein